MKRRFKRLVAPFLYPTGCNLIAFCIVAVAVACETALACGQGSNGYDRKSFKTPMHLEQSIPNVGETSIGASGAYRGRVWRGTKAFKALVKNYNPLIVFKDDEKNEGDRLMTTRCQQMLERLAEAVKIKWGSKGVKLRVIDAYNLDERTRPTIHGSKSLHHEGRAVDFSTSDRDRSKYPELGRMAVEAGFDWVLYLKNYIHASVKSEIDAKQEKVGCFPETATVRLENGRTKTMKQLQIGDKVESMDSNGRLAYSKVLAFLDYKPNSDHDFITIVTKDPSTEVTITASHLIYQANKQTQRETVLLARDIIPGSFVYVRNGTSFEKFTAGRVSGVKMINGKGAYAPLTESGNIVVNNVLCSCYAVMPNHDVAHWSFAPLRFADWIFPGIAAYPKHQDGLHWYAEFLHKIYRGWNYVKAPFLG